MRIVMVSPMPPSPTGPGAIPRVLHAGLTGLLERHDVTVVAVAGPDEWELEAVEALAGEGVDVRGVRRTEPTGAARWRRRVRLAHGWGVRRHPWRTVWFWERGLQGAIDRLLHETPPDVIQVEDNAMGVYRYQGPAPVVLSEYEVRRSRSVDLGRGLAGPIGGRLVRELDWRRWRRYQPSVWGRFDRVLVFSERDARSASEIAPGIAPRIRVTPFGIELPPPVDLGLEAPGSLLFIGNYSHPPNVDAALWLAREILPAVRRRHPSARLALVGDQAPEAVRRLTGPGVEVTGRVNDVRPWLERAEVVLAPVRIGGGMRMKVLEAMATGKAVVTTARGTDGLGAGAPVRIAEDAEGIAAATCALLEDGPERAALARAARAYAAERHSPSAYARRLEGVYEELVRSSRPGALGTATR